MSTVFIASDQYYNDCKMVTHALLLPAVIWNQTTCYGIRQSSPPYLQQPDYSNLTVLHATARHSKCRGGAAKTRWFWDSEIYPKSPYANSIGISLAITQVYFWIGWCNMRSLCLDFKKSSSITADAIRTANTNPMTFYWIYSYAVINNCNHLVQYTGWENICAAWIFFFWYLN